MQPDAAKRKLVRSWLQKASEDLRVADRAMLPPPLLGGAVFHCQQAAEKALKGFLAWHDQPFRKTHSLEELVGQCEPIDNAFVELLAAAKALSPYVGEFRYPGDEDSPSIESTHNAVALARQVVQFVTQRLPPEAAV